MVNAAETAVQRTITAAFIQASPRTLTLSRPFLAGDGAGGQTTVYSDLPGQEFRMILANGRPVVRRTVDGREIVADYVLIGRHNADVKQGDRFTMNDDLHEILWVRPDTPEHRYETWAEVASRG